MKRLNKEKVNQANQEIQKVVDFLKENYEAFDNMDLKLHYVSYYCYSKFSTDFPLLTDETDWFYMFCDDQYFLFKEDLQLSKGIDFDGMRYQLGRTSSFYLHDRNIIDINANRIDYKNTIYNFIDKNYNDVIYTDDYLLDAGFIDEEKRFDDDEISDIEDTLDYIISDLYKDVIAYCEDIITAYTALKDFKDNQVEIFKEYLQYYQDEKEEEIRLEKEAQEKALIKVIEVIKKYNIKSDDLQVLASNYNILSKVN